MSLWVYASECGDPKQASRTHKYVRNCLTLCRTEIIKEFPGKHSNSVKYGWSSLQSTSALPTVVPDILSWNKSVFDHLCFVVAVFWISATFSLFTIGDVYSYITVKGNQQHFVGKHWFQCLRDPPPIRLEHKVHLSTVNVSGEASGPEFLPFGLNPTQLSLIDLLLLKGWSVSSKSLCFNDTCSYLDWTSQEQDSSKITWATAF